MSAETARAWARLAEAARATPGDAPEPVRPPTPEEALAASTADAERTAGVAAAAAKVERRKAAEALREELTAKLGRPPSPEEFFQADALP